MSRWICTALIVVLCGCGSTPRERVTDGRPGGAAPQAYFVSPEWVTGELARPNVLVVDVRPLSAFESGHVPRALWLDPNELFVETDGIPEQVPESEKLTEIAQTVGLRSDSTVVFYGEMGSPLAAWAARTYRAAGLHRTYVLDGGFQTWLRQGLQPETGRQRPTRPGDFAAADATGDIVSGTWVQEHLGDGEVIIVDTRSEDEYYRGHIPGAVHLDWAHNFATDGRLLAPTELENLYRTLGIEPKGGGNPRIVLYSDSGTRAALSFLALKQIGVDDVVLYDGSWIEWAQAGFDRETGAPTLGGNTGFRAAPTTSDEIDGENR
ncbi:MAG: rhodanese-like domain-containing protein [Planctomycetota bacterium]